MSARDDVLTLKKRIAESIIGQETMVERVLLGLLANGNLLVERGEVRRAGDVPGRARSVRA